MAVSHPLLSPQGPWQMEEGEKVEEGEKLQQELNDIGAEIARVSAQAESAKDAEDKRYFREKELMLRKKELMLLEARGSLPAAAGAAAGQGTAQAGAATGLGVGSAPGDVVLERLEQLKLELGEQAKQLKLELGEIREEIRDQSQFVRVLMQGEFTATSSKDSTPYRENAFRYYGYSASPKTVQCMVTGEHMPIASIKAGHIFRQGWNRGFLPLLGVTSVHDPRNIILVRTEVETAFDRFELAIIPQNENGVECYQIYVLKESLLLNPREQFIGTGDTAKSDTHKWKDVHTKYLHVAGDNLPARRLLAFHAHHAIKHAVSAGWQKPGEVIVSQAGWVSPGYDRELMRKYLEGAVTSEGLLIAASEDNQSQ